MHGVDWRVEIRVGRQPFLNMRVVGVERPGGLRTEAANQSKGDQSRSVRYKLVKSLVWGCEKKMGITVKEKSQ